MRRWIFFSAISMVLSLVALFWASARYNKLDVKCRGEFESHIGADSLAANVGVNFEKGKGILNIAGEVHGKESLIKYIKIATVFNYSTHGKLMYIKVSQQYSSISVGEIESKLQHLLPLVLSSRNVEYVYEFQPQSGGDYLIKQHGIPILYCKKV
ncbi:MAG: hypothetical protein E7L23_18870 [Klebsiella grimontii]|nr:hypothetical protein [Klebsiella grimontii]